MYRFYIVPIETYQSPNTLYRGPKYFPWKWSHMVDPQSNLLELEGVTWGNLHYGRENSMIVCADVTPAQHTLLAAQPGIMSLPENIDQTMTSGAVTTAKAYLENLSIPAGWVNTSLTYRSVLRTIAGMFMFVQRIGGISKKKISELGITLETQWKNILTATQIIIRDAADSLGLDSSAVTGNTRVREILKIMADQFSTHTYQIAGYTL